MYSECVTAIQRPFLLTRWWLKTREVEPIIYSNGLVGAAHEFYVPIWAKPLDFLHALIFGSTKINQ